MLDFKRNVIYCIYFVEDIGQDTELIIIFLNRNRCFKPAKVVENINMTSIFHRVINFNKLFNRGNAISSLINI